MYEELIRRKNSTSFEKNKYAPFGYDAVLMLARALNATEETLKAKNQSLRDFTYERQDIAEVIKKEISNTDNINGLTVSRTKYCTGIEGIIIIKLFNILHCSCDFL